MEILTPRHAGSSRRARRLGGTFAILNLLASLPPSAAAQDSPSPSALAREQEAPREAPEYALKAAFLLNFAKYVEWPPHAFDKPDTPFLVGVLGSDPFGDELERTFRNKTVRGRAFRVQRFRDLRELQRSHMLFISRSEGPRLANVLDHIKSWDVLTVAEEEGFALRGVVITILIEDKRPKLEVNADAAERAKLTISSKLLRLATIVRPEG